VPRLFTIFTAMKRFFFLLAMLLAPLAWAQDDPHFLHGFGYDYSIGVPRNNAGQLFMGNGLNYVPRYVFPVNENFSYGLGLPVGASLVQSLVSGASALGVNYALCGSVHAGMGATAASTKMVGGFFSLGLGSYDVNYFDLYGMTRDAHYGPYVEAGFRIPYYGQDLTIAIANWRGMNAANGRSQVFSVKLIYEFF
jgi:hypothetical protein